MSLDIHTSTLVAMGLRTRVLQAGHDLRATEAVVFVHGNPGAAYDGERKSWIPELSDAAME